MASLFVSFSFADRLMAEQLVASLQTHGISAWLCTEELRAGGTFDAQIEAAIKSRDHGLLLLSPSSAASAECHAEWRFMLSQPGHRFYVAQLVPTPLQDISYRLRIYQYADLTQNFEAGAEALAHAILTNADLDPAEPTTHLRTPVSGDLPWWQVELPMIDRRSELAALTRAITERHRVMLVGGGGVGKTRLAVEAALTAAFPDGVVWFRLPAADSLANATRDVALLTDLLRNHLHLPPSTEAMAVWNHLGQTRLLLVLDNAEECQYPQPYAAQVNHLATLGGTSVLLTSRYDWPDLRQFHTLPLDPPARTTASHIVQQLAGHLAGHMPVTEEEATALAEAGHDNPRLLTAAVPLLNTYPVGEVIDRLRALRGRSLEEATQEIVHHTLELMSQQPDGPIAHMALRKLVACRGGFTLTAAQALLGSDVEALEALRAWSVLHFDGWRYSLETLVLAVVAPDDDDYPAFYRYYSELTLILVKRQQYAELAAELPNLQSALDWALRTGRVRSALGLVIASGEMLHNRGLFTLEREWLQQVTVVRPNDEGPTFEAVVENGWGRFYLRQPLGDRRGNILAGLAAFTRALTHCSPEKDASQYAATQANLGATYVRLAELEQPEHHLRLAAAALHKAILYGDRTANPLGYANTLDNLGNTYKVLAALTEPAANLERAFAAYTEALVYRTPTTAPLDYAHTLGNLAGAYILLATLEDYSANMEQAAALFGEALEYHTYELAPHAYAKAQLNLGTTWMKLGEFTKAPEKLAQAATAFTQSLRVFTSAQYPQEYAMVQHNLGALCQAKARLVGADQVSLLTDAIAAYEQALAYRPETTAPLLRGTTLHSLGTAYRMLAGHTDEIEHLQQARSCYEQALPLRIGETWSYALTQDSLGNLYRDLAMVTGQPGYLAQSLAAFALALELYTPTDTPLDYARTQANRALTYYDACQLTQAVADWLAAAALYQRQNHALEGVVK